MANPNFRQDGDKNVLNTVVLWCCCGFFFIICGYGLYRQHTLEQRVIVLEKQFEEFHRGAKVEEPVLSSGPELSRKERDVGDCICPPDEMKIQPEIELSPTAVVNENQPGTSICHNSIPASSAIDAVQVELPAVETSLDPQLDEEILNLLGETPSRDKKYGADIRAELAVRWEHIATTGLAKDTKKELLEKHLVPKNCTKIDAPKLNPEIKAALSDMLIKKDKALENKQLQVAASISCLSEALTILFSLDQKDQRVIKLLIEAGRLMCDSQHNESMTRRSFICSTIKKEIKDHLFNTEIDCFLFGEQLADTLKAAKAISKSGAEIKINTPIRKAIPMQKPRQASAQSLNQKPPLPASRHTGAARRTEPAPRQRQQQRPRPPPRLQQRPAHRR